MAGAALSFVLMAGSAKGLGPAIPAVQKVFWRSLFAAVVTLVALLRAGVPLWPSRPWLLLLRGVVGFGGIYTYFEAIGRLPLGNAVTLHNTHPVFTGLIAALFLRETLHRKQLLATLVCLAGVAFVFRPQPDAPLVGSAFGLATGILAAGAYVCVRALNRTEHPMVIVLGFALVSIPLSLAFCWDEFVWPVGEQWAWIFAIGFFTQTAQICLVHGLRRHSAARATQVGYLGAVFAVLLGLAFGDAFPRWNVVLGIAVIVAALVVYRPEEAPVGDA
jgi:drug/metabolite transporter (DMT)-like permease